MPLGEGLFSPIAGWRMWLASRLGATAARANRLDAREPARS